MIETFFVMILFLIYIGLWSIKRIILIKTENIDPQVMDKSISNIQKYMNSFTTILTIYMVILIPLHTLNIQFFSLFSRFDLLSRIQVDIIGFCLGLIGLLFCLYAQIKMGKSWRVGIDQNTKTELITSGMYSLIRNPTYLGLIMVCIGLWLIWPTLTIFIFSGLFFLFLEIQVRCEEDFLENEFENEYLDYKKETKRYFPFIY